jgi:quercetin dioxygenase-like cupin family protein
VGAGEDREGVPPRGRLGATTFKVLTHETQGGLFVMEQLHRSKGAGPDRHLHHEQDELFFVIEGEYIAEIGSQRFHLTAGDSVLGPRGTPHAYVFVGSTPGRMLISYAPAGKMEAYFRHFSAPGRAAPTDPSSEAMMKWKLADYAEYGMQYLGPPLTIE